MSITLYKQTAKRDKQTQFIVQYSYWNNQFGKLNKKVGNLSNSNLRTPLMRVFPIFSNQFKPEADIGRGNALNDVKLIGR